MMAFFEMSPTSLSRFYNDKNMFQSMFLMSDGLVKHWWIMVTTGFCWRNIVMLAVDIWAENKLITTDQRYSLFSLNILVTDLKISYQNL